MTIILHNDDHSTVEVLAIRKALQLKALDWSEATQPNIPSPRLEIDGTHYVGQVEIMDALERLAPDPTLYPNGNTGMPLALSYWAQAFYEEGADAATGNQHIAQHLNLIGRQLHDGRSFLQGERPGLADIYSYAAVEGLILTHHARMDAILMETPKIMRWHRQMSALA